jgi:hypothetical protein
VILEDAPGDGLNAIAALRDRGWVLHSWAAWRALIHLVRNPFLWEKTPHGLTAHVPAPEPATAAA